MNAVKLTSLILFLLICIQISIATCTITLDKTSYLTTETATASISCDSGNEKSQAYTVTWQNSTDILEVDTGTTPSTLGQFFFSSYTFPTGSNFEGNVSMTGTNLEGEDFFTVLTPSTITDNSSLIITNITFTDSSRIFLGKRTNVEFQVRDENGKTLSNAQCIGEAEDGNSYPITTASAKSYNGYASFGDVLTVDTFNEDREYLIEISCYCGSSSSGLSCIDEDGGEVTNSVGEASAFFTINKYLTVNTVTDLTSYNLKDYLYICVNVTNPHYYNPIDMEISHAVRCSAGIDNNDDLDRVLVVSDATSPDKRRIEVNTTQMQCKRFYIPEIEYYQGKTSTCYASTQTYVLSEAGNKLLHYSTTSPSFTIVNNELNVLVDWVRSSNNRLVFNSIINLSNPSFYEWNGTGIGNLDIKLITDSQVLDPNIRKVVPGIDMNSLILSKYIKSITATNLSGDAISTNIDFNEDGALEIELPNVDISRNGWYNVTMELYDFEENQSISLQRQAVALEGVENKTGIFHLDVECPSQGLIGGDITCTITAFVEDEDTLQKETSFTCYINDGSNNFSSLNFNQMVTKDTFSVSRNFSVLSNFTNDIQYLLQCHADYYAFGSRRDSFYDTFTAKTVLSEESSSSSSSRGRMIRDQIVGVEESSSTTFEPQISNFGEKEDNQEKENKESSSVERFVEKVIPESKGITTGLIAGVVILMAIIIFFKRWKTVKIEI